jgi:hypothetical protein
VELITEVPIAKLSSQNGGISVRMDSTAVVVHTRGHHVVITKCRSTTVTNIVGACVYFTQWLHINVLR